MGKRDQKLIRFPGDEVYRFVKEAFLRVGVMEEVAELTARGLWSTSLRGTDSHGIRLLPHYVAGVEGGRISPWRWGNPTILTLIKSFLLDSSVSSYYVWYPEVTDTST